MPDLSHCALTRLFISPQSWTYGRDWVPSWLLLLAWLPGRECYHFPLTGEKTKTQKA